MKLERIDPSNHMSELVDLARIEYGNSEIANNDYLAWQYIYNPAGNAIVVVARDDSGMLAGQYVVIPAFFRFDGSIIKGTLSVNTLTHPDYRGQGLFTKMANMAYAVCEQEKYLVTLGYANKNSFPGFIRKLKFEHIGNADILFKLLKLRGILKGFPKFRDAPKYSPSQISLSREVIGDIRSGPFVIKPIEFLRDAVVYDELITNQESPKYSLYKNAEYCNWRFEKIPTREYNAYQAQDESGVQAVCVIRNRKIKGIECAFIIEMQLAHGINGIRAGKALLQELGRIYKHKGSVVMGTMANAGSQTHSLAKRFGFRSMPQRFLPHNAPIVLRSNGFDGFSRINSDRGWAFSFDDYDVF